MNRRNFLKQTGLMAAALAPKANPAMRQLKAGMYLRTLEALGHPAEA